MRRYIYHNRNWPYFEWNPGRITKLLTAVRFRQGRLIGQMQGLGFELQNEAVLKTMTLEVQKSSEIEGEMIVQVLCR